jgi:hypothetical protein
MGRESPSSVFRSLGDVPFISTTRHPKSAANDSPSPRGRLELLGKQRKEFGEAEGPPGRTSGSE